MDSRIRPFLGSTHDNRELSDHEMSRFVSYDKIVFQIITQTKQIYNTRIFYDSGTTLWVH
jgi:hypothetical protein